MIWVTILVIIVGLVGRNIGRLLHLRIYKFANFEFCFARICNIFSVCFITCGFIAVSGLVDHLSVLNLRLLHIVRHEETILSGIIQLGRWLVPLESRS